nr:hypothetical protein JVH1_7845 [Rhodococcus sp. JVH1]
METNPRSATARTTIRRIVTTSRASNAPDKFRTDASAPPRPEKDDKRFDGSVFVLFTELSPRFFTPGRWSLSDEYVAIALIAYLAASAEFAPPSRACCMHSSRATSRGVYRR